MSEGKRSYAEILRVTNPSLEVAARSRDANWFGLLVAALIERGSAMRLEEVAARLAEIGHAEAEAARRSLSRCRPDRDPVFRVGDLYDLDPQSDEASLWAFRLGLRPPDWQLDEQAAGSAPETLPAPEPTAAITLAALEEAWRVPNLSGWTCQRLVICALEALGGRAQPGEVRDMLEARGWAEHALPDLDQSWRANVPIRTDAGGRWELLADHPAVAAARAAVAKAIEADRKRRQYISTPADVAKHEARRNERDHAARARLGTMRRALVAAFPPDAPRLLSVLDLAERSIETFSGDELPAAMRRLSDFDFIGAVGVRVLLTRLGFDWGERMLADLGPPQKSIRLGRRRDSLKIDLALLLESSCKIARGFGDPKQMRADLAKGHLAKVRHRLEADLRSLLALYQYGVTHGAYRIRRGKFEEMLRVPWCDWREPAALSALRRMACRDDLSLEVVLDRAPAWEDPWGRARFVVLGGARAGSPLVDSRGWVHDDRDVQVARLGPPIAELVEEEERRDEEARWAGRESAGVGRAGLETLVESWTQRGHEAETPEAAIEAYEKAMTIAAQVLGPEVFERDAGHFWGLVETRPYMRARFSLAQACAECSRPEEAAEHYRELLRLSANDNLGVRYSLLPLLIQIGRFDEAQDLAVRFDESTAHWLYPKALLAHVQGRDRIEVIAAMRRALKANAHVVPMLAGEIETPEPVGYYGIGDEHEAASVIEVGFEAWARHEAALELLLACSMM